MNAQTSVVRRFSVGPCVVLHEACEGLPRGRWIRIQRALERIRLLLGSPIASFRWARAKRRAASGKKKNSGASDWQGRRSNSFAACEQDGIVMGF
jgi:hypothetical protein